LDTGYAGRFAKDWLCLAAKFGSTGDPDMPLNG
jgi:hypothetical protein